MLKDAIVKGEVDKIDVLIKKLLDDGRRPNEILKEMISGMGVVGEKFEKKEYYVPETLLSAYTMQKGLDIIKPLLAYEKASTHGRIVIGTVEGDIHDIGKNLVAMFLEGAGFEVHNLGRDVSTSVFIEKAQELKPDIIGLSAMMSTTIEKMGEIIKEFEERGMRDGIAFVIGGAAATNEIAKEIGADGYAADATKAVRLCETLMEKKRK